jgi:UDP-N-acetylglucosamine pyrophosphorylase
MYNRQIIILAAGNGSRMQSNLPKVMHKIGSLPMIEMVLSNSAQITKDIILVYSELLAPYLKPYANMCKFVLQTERRGTAHACFVASDLIDDNKIVSVIYGDNPLIYPKLIEQLLNHLEQTNSALTTLSFQHKNIDNQYGRIIVDDNGDFVKIVEFKYANEDEKKIELCNSGIMAFAPGILKKYLPYTMNQKTDYKEFYLTSIVEICKNHREKISHFLSKEHESVIGINTEAELITANLIFKHSV